ncbi:MAG TPA: DinB family protein [Acidimicrobiales bacterium]|nr:DinB family protein [Acidimicrobiales bacterium]
MEPCSQCGYRYDSLAAPELPAAIRDLGGRYRTRLTAPAGAADFERIVRTRPAPETWSALEYACHVRDVLFVQRERLHLALVEDCPSFTPMYREQRVQSARYAAQEPEVVAREIDVGADLLARDLSYLDSEGWARRCVYNFPAPAERTLLWLAQHTVHEGEHHLGDVDAALATARGETH